MEQVVFADDLSVQLTPPDCDFQHPNCRGEADTIYFAHGCASHFCCSNCRKFISDQMSRAARRFGVLKCGKCGLAFTLDKFVSWS